MLAMPMAMPMPVGVWTPMWHVRMPLPVGLTTFPCPAHAHTYTCRSSLHAICWPGSCLCLRLNMPMPVDPTYFSSNSAPSKPKQCQLYAYVYIYIAPLNISCVCINELLLPNSSIFVPHGVPGGYGSCAPLPRGSQKDTGTREQV